MMLIIARKHAEGILIDLEIVGVCHEETSNGDCKLFPIAGHDYCSLHEKMIAGGRI